MQRSHRVDDAATACSEKGQDEPRNDRISGNSWWLIKWAQSLRIDLRTVPANVNGMGLAVAFQCWEADEWRRAASTS